MTIQELQCFLAVAQTLNFTKAGEKLFISQPVVSRHIQSLETELGFALLDRNVRRNIRLTQAGEQFYDCVKRCSEDFDNTVKTLQDAAQQSQIIFTIPEGSSLPGQVLRLLNDFRLACPQHRPLLKTAGASDIPAAFDDGDIVFCSEDEFPAARNAQTIRITPDPLPYQYVLAHNHPLAGMEPDVILEQIRERPEYNNLLMSANTPRKMASSIIDICTRAFSRVPTLLYLDDYNTLWVYLMAGSGFAVVPPWSRLAQSAEFIHFPAPMQTHYYIYMNPDKPVPEHVWKYLMTGVLGENG